MESNEERYNFTIEDVYPGFKKFFECFSRFKVKINVDNMSEYDYYKSLVFDGDSDDEIDYRYSDNDSDDEIDCDSDDIGFKYGNGEEPETDSDEYDNVIYEFLSMILND